MELTNVAIIICQALTPGLTPTPAGDAAQTTSPWSFTLSSAGVRSGVRGRAVQAESVKTPCSKCLRFQRWKLQYDEPL